MDTDSDFEALQRRWRAATREWLAARNEFARMQDEPVTDLARAQAVARRLQLAEQRRTVLALEVETWLSESAAMP